MLATIIGGVFFLGSQAWEWSHFIHGGGGSFLLATEVTITADNGEEYVLPVGEPIFMDHHFGEIAEAYSNGDASVNLHEHHGQASLHVSCGAEGVTGATLVFQRVVGALGHRHEHRGQASLRVSRGAECVAGTARSIQPVAAIRHHLHGHHGQA